MSNTGRVWVRNPLRRLREYWFRPLQSSLDAAQLQAAQLQDALAREVDALAREVDALGQEIRYTRFAMASIQALNARGAASIREAEFKGYSQFGEDGAIQWLLTRVPIVNRNFVEFGVDDYSESNTRFLLEHDNWSGLIIDRGVEHIRFVERRGLGWRSSIDTRSAFVTAEDINELLAGQPADTGLLSIDIDGVDYWVLSAITAIRPRIIVCEYNSIFGPTAAVSVPYAADFDRHSAHPSMLYFGASISALAHWSSQHGYRLVGSSAHGVNAFLVRDDVADGLPNLSGPEAWVESTIRQARDERGDLTYLGGLGVQRGLIRTMPLVDVITGSTLTVADLV